MLKDQKEIRKVIQKEIMHKVEDIDRMGGSAFKYSEIGDLYCELCKMSKGGLNYVWAYDAYDKAIQLEKLPITLIKRAVISAKYDRPDLAVADLISVLEGSWTLTPYILDGICELVRSPSVIEEIEDIKGDAIDAEQVLKCIDEHAAKTVEYKDLMDSLKEIFGPKNSPLVLIPSARSLILSAGSSQSLPVTMADCALSAFRKEIQEMINDTSMSDAELRQELGAYLQKLPSNDNSSNCGSSAGTKPLGIKLQTQ